MSRHAAPDDASHWNQHLTDEDRELDRLWRLKFGEPLPIRHAGTLVRRILQDGD